MDTVLDFVPDRLTCPAYNPVSLEMVPRGSLKNHAYISLEANLEAYIPLPLTP